MAELKILGKRGDETMTWTVEDEVATKAAAEKFAELLLDGHLAFSVPAEPGSGNGKLIREFDPNAERIILAPPISGG